MLISCYVRMMLFWIENQYCYGLKISEPQVCWLKESYLEESKNAIFQKVSEILLDIILGLLINFKNMAGPNHDCIWEKGKM